MRVPLLDSANPITLLWCVESPCCTSPNIFLDQARINCLNTQILFFLATSLRTRAKWHATFIRERQRRHTVDWCHFLALSSSNFTCECDRVGG
jgi:hypothetical protein